MRSIFVDRLRVSDEILGSRLHERGYRLSSGSSFRRDTFAERDVIADEVDGDGFSLLIVIGVCCVHAVDNTVLAAVLSSFYFAGITGGWFDRWRKKKNPDQPVLSY